MIANKQIICMIFWMHLKKIAFLEVKEQKEERFERHFDCSKPSQNLILRIYWMNF